MKLPQSKKSALFPWNLLKLNLGLKQAPKVTKAPVKSASFPWNLLKLNLGLKKAPEGDKGSREVDGVEVTTAEVELRVPDEPRAVESPEGREAPRIAEMNT